MDLPYSELAHLFLNIRSTIKLYHWQTRSYARHKATDKFLETFEPLVDRFVEAAQGVAGAERVGSWCDLSVNQQKTIHTAMRGPAGAGTAIYWSPDDNTASAFLTKFRNHIEQLEFLFPELAQIRDDMLEICDITLYLFTLE